MKNKNKIQEKVGFIGLGNMGHPMAKNLEYAGFELSVYNRTAVRAADFVQNSTVCADIADLVKNATLIFTMLTNDEAVERVYNEIVENEIEGKLFVDMSTISIDMSQKICTLINSKGGHFLDAPVAGSTKPAEEGKLIIMVGGTEINLHRALPYLEKMGKKVKYLGPNGKGLAAKISINYFLSIIYEGLAETVLLSDHLGIDRSDMLEIINESASGSGATLVKTPMLLKSDYKPAFSLNLMLKDIKLASCTEATSPTGKTVLDVFQKASDHGYGEKDVISVIEFLKNVENKR
ncbi:NAD(P)-dependent oxidoreductase [uncultured Sphingobacterium sp.]|uniref:NAD(P)-dependent oxidoreductase n=1 Tax=uncultured Sphingobacterium sp. TaxID=182688 RepID=UPI003749BD92